ncbi:MULTISPECIES: helix-turn-helix transcriptional regulator [Streptomyces]|uniref:helix-turn-helix domain-containing protein n=2 Tax=Streptomyces TaxID=1883 RepID=UPI001F2AA12D|nr:MULTISPECIES: LuxR C-terminal-related transcriptional regulator [Streptomyces]MDX2918682.1 LuxR C-terminal-related transcriptional regulator [Streptomyces sp. NE06-03C]MDX3607432.1 LuxR C-terminal-related transcriptional regulator [Streptomyces sp. FL06-04B]MDX3734971.1 LuxR C-terminal-related transcriptional regulator [Streptomyces sp. ID01-15D]
MEETAVTMMADEQMRAGGRAGTAVGARRAMDFATLTERELEVLVLLASGEQNRWLARRLGITERTVRAHTSSIVRKLNLKSRFEAAIVSYLHAEDIRGLRP